MADSVTSKENLKSWFVTGAKPTQNQFSAWMDSYWHKSETISIANITDLANALVSKANVADMNTGLSKKVDKEDGKSLSTNDYTNQEKQALDQGRIDFINYNYGGSDGDHFMREADTIYIDLTPNDTTGFDPNTKKGLLCFSIETIEDKADTTPTVDLGQEKIQFRWTDADNNTQTRTLYSNTIGTNGIAPKVQLKDLYGNVSIAYFTTDNYGQCLLVSSISSGSTISTGSITTAQTLSLSSTTTSYTVDADTATMVKLTATAAGCTITLPNTLQADKAVTFLITDDSQPVTIGDTIYQPGDTVFSVFDYDDTTQTGTWAVNNTIQPTVDDYADVTAKFMVTDAVTYKTALPRYCLHLSSTTYPYHQNTGQLLFLPQKLLYNNQTLDAHATYEPEAGLYYIDSVTTGDAADWNRVYIRKITPATNLKTVRVSTGTTAQTGMWQNEYDGAHANTVKFERLADKAQQADLTNLIANVTNLSSAERAVCVANFSTTTNIAILATNVYYPATFATKTLLGGLGTTTYTSYDGNTVRIEADMLARLEVYANLMFSSSSTDICMSIYKNETIIDTVDIRSPSTASYRFMMSTATVAQLAAGDLITVRFMTTSNKNPISFAGGHLIISNL